MWGCSPLYDLVYIRWMVFQYFNSNDIISSFLPALDNLAKGCLVPETPAPHTSWLRISVLETLVGSDKVELVSIFLRQALQYANL
ncbi:hypothetical protein EB796_011480 [Bugula neritina]|uniref:Uncharacterized protein n=1 Tax=Bugula neritina TaxID=10212 RepID=A0A7J7JUZ4_BUGNE|nr:hypothetical protein EB796_011480 [Bugula neritina]